MVMDKRWEQLDNPEANEARAKVIEIGAVGGHWDSTQNNRVWRAKQEQEVLDARFKIEELATRIAAHKEEGEKILQWIKENEIPGIDSWMWSISEIEDNDLVGDAIKWAASNHNC